MPIAAGALALFPGALGDFVCFLPALATLRQRHAGRLGLVAQPAFLPLVHMTDLDPISIDRRFVADLFASAAPPTAETISRLGGFATVHSWTGFGNAEFAQRLSAISAGPVHVHQFRGMQGGEAAADYYARCVGGVWTDPAAIIADDARWMDAWLHATPHTRFVVMHPGSGSAAKNWRGFEALCRYWQQHHDDRIVILSGPAECESETGRSSEDRSGGVVHAHGLGLPQVAALLRRCALYVGNDSGISHLAGAVGGRGVVLFGPSDPQVWAPRSAALRVIHAPEGCAACGPEVLCTHRLPVGRVIEALEMVAR